MEFAQRIDADSLYFPANKIIGGLFFLEKPVFTAVTAPRPEE
jgi:hypothetical protein